MCQRRPCPLGTGTQHIRQVILPALNAGQVVICDRYYDATLVYQGYARGLDLSIIHALDDIVVPDMKPFLTILLDLDVEEGLRRNRRAQKEDRFELETVEFHNRVRQGFMKIAGEEPDRVKIVDASQGKDEVTRDIIKIVEEVWH